MNCFDLVNYRKRFDEALKNRYDGNDFKAGLEKIKIRFKPVGLGTQELTIDDVMAIFGSKPPFDLPFVEDWTKPDADNLGERMQSMAVAKKIADLRRDHYDLALLTNIIYCFRDLSLTALVLQHVYPTHFV